MTKDLVLSKDNLNNNLSMIEQVVIQGDLAKLSPEDRVKYYKMVCESVGINPLTRPFDYIVLNGKLTLYAKKDCTEQLRRIHGISIEGLDDKIVDDLYIVKAKARDKHGRTDESTGAVNIGNLKGEAKANAIMKAETKAKRRVTLSISGLGWVDETEIETIPGAKNGAVNLETGEITVDIVNIAPEKANCVNSSQPEENNCDNSSQNGKISIQQLDEIEKLEARVDSECKKNFRDYLWSEYKIKDLKYIPVEGFAPCVRGLWNNIRMNENNQQGKIS